MAALSSLADESQAKSILELIRHNKEALIGHMPIKVTYPALEGERWSTLTGSDPKNTPWSYQNAGGWPFLLWLLPAAEAKTGASALTEEAMRIAETRISIDTWPEYYDGPHSRLVGKEAKLNQVWSAAGYIIADRKLQDPGLVDPLRIRRECRRNRMQHPHSTYLRRGAGRGGAHRHQLAYTSPKTRRKLHSKWTRAGNRSNSTE